MSESMKTSIVGAAVGAIITGAISLAIFFLGNFSTQDTIEKKTVETLTQYFDSVDENMSYEEALQTISNDTKQLKEKTNEIIIQNAKSFADSSEYKKALKLLIGVENKTAEIEALILEYTREYETFICEQAEVLVVDGKLDDASSLITEAQEILPDSQILIKKKEEIERSYPKNMLDIVPAYQFGGNSYTEYIAGKSGEIKSFSMGGIKYTNGMTFDADINIFEEVSWAVYNLNNEYTSLEFILCHVDGTDNGDETVLQIFYDGELKKEINMAPDMSPKSVKLDVSGVTQLKFQVPASGGSNPLYGLGNPVIK